jgi:hypothetical protein
MKLEKALNFWAEDMNRKRVPLFIALYYYFKVGMYCTVLYSTVLYCTVLYCTVLYCTVLHCTVLYCTVLYCTVLYYTYTVLFILFYSDFLHPNIVQTCKHVIINVA